MKPLLLVDGYNVIGAWSEAQRAGWPLDECRDRLVSRLEDYAGYTGQEVWAVFDGYRAQRPLHTVDRRAGVTVVFTRQGETADRFIERMCHIHGRLREVRVASSDGVEQTIALGRGATRLSARELWGEMARAPSLSPAQPAGRTSLSAALSAQQYAELDKLRRQK